MLPFIVIELMFFGLFLFMLVSAVDFYSHSKLRMVSIINRKRARTGMYLFGTTSVVFLVLLVGLPTILFWL